MKRVLIIGAYGNFGRAITKLLAQEPEIRLILAGRDAGQAAALAASLNARQAPEAVRLDIAEPLGDVLAALHPDIVIHASGPFQGQDTRVAQACIAQGSHYLDLADGRDFVAGISALDGAARARAVLVCSGVSSVPCLTSAVVDHYRPRFGVLEALEYAIATAHLTNRGTATAAAVLSYAGKRFATLVDGRPAIAYGWQGLRFRRFWGLGLRAMADCDIPDLALFPERYPELKTIRFQAGTELVGLQLGLWCLTWLVRLRVIGSLRALAPTLVRSSRIFDALGGDNSGFYMKLDGTDPAGRSKQICFELVARQGDGLNIPSLPAVLMARKLAAGQISATGARPCMGFLTLDELLAGFGKWNIAWRERP